MAGAFRGDPTHWHNAPMRHWLMKVEPLVYSIADLERDGKTGWEGVRNYQARNHLRDDMKPGDPVLFYHSSAEPTGVAGLAEVSRAAYPDPLAFDRKSEYFDAKSKKDAPTWFAVEIRFVERFPAVVPLETLKATRGLENMLVIKRGMRLSVQPVSPAEFEIVRKLGRGKG
jgi:predicted RNA-binding protein with PUA-like domain